jgi:SAM-dependent methyltransferase
MCKDFSWSELYQHRRAAAARFGKIFALPLVKRVREVLLSCVNDGARVLEVGAGDRGMLAWLRQERRDVTYESMDIDRNGAHEYHDLAAITQTYDCVCAFEVIEHLTLDEIPPWLRKLGELLRPGGRLVLSTPNTYYPPAYLRDATHRTPLCYDELAGLVQSAGFDVERIVRIYHDPLPRRLLRQYLFGWLFRLIGIDFARQIVLVAVKPGTR